MLARVLLLIAGFSTALSGCETVPARVSGAPSRTVDAVRYRVVVSESALHDNHGSRHTIEEIYIPEYGICFNRAGGAVHAFFRNEDRRGNPDSEQKKWAYDYREEIQVPRDIARAMRELATANKLIMDLSEEWYGSKTLEALIREVDNPHDYHLRIEEVEIPEGF